jgi:hypothetical protein
MNKPKHSAGYRPGPRIGGYPVSLGAWELRELRGSFRFQLFPRKKPSTKYSTVQYCTVARKLPVSSP